jgi:membrane-bound lytic murein transglycosylase
MQSISARAANPRAAAGAQCQSQLAFRELALAPGEGPLGALGVPLSANAASFVDRRCSPAAAVCPG